MSAPTIFDRALLRARHRRAAAQGPATFLLDRVAADLAERLATVKRGFAGAIDIGTPTDALRRVLAASGQVASITEAPLGDDEVLQLPEDGFDLAVSALALHYVNDLPGVLAQIRRALKPDGLLLAALAGGDTLTELRQAFARAESEIEGGLSPRIAPFTDLRDIGALMQRAGFALPVIDSDRIVVRYDQALALMNDLRRMGATNMLTERRRAPLRRATLKRAVEIYGEQFADADGRVRATFEIIWLSGWVPHASQQQPLRPGSAKTRLADALGVEEKSAGEKPSSKRS
ncbi:MAG: methyltransferase domain-containing protein [Pseudolabrys sp.]|nr:methyltransferase domain-containing protein [Pseudolabrys sp.]